MKNDEVSLAIERLRRSRDLGVQWLLRHIGSDGEPAGARERNGWARIPWALAVAGESSAASSVLAWAERAALTSDGCFRPGPAQGNGRFPAYPMAHLAIGSWLLERYDTAMSLMDGLRKLQYPQSGGFRVSASPQEHEAKLCDLLSTAQAGIAGLMTRQNDIVEGAHRWVLALHASQPALPQRLYSFCNGNELLTSPAQNLKWLAVTEFDQPRQSFYTPGIAAVFLAGWATQRQDQQALALGHEFLQLNRGGISAQFEDAESVQICKFGWGVAAMAMADARVDQTPDLLRMAEWFPAHQDEDGAWGLSTFLMPKSGVIEKMSKTAEHVMEVNAMLAALGTVLARRAVA